MGVTGDSTGALDDGEASPASSASYDETGADSPLAPSGVTASGSLDVASAAVGSVTDSPATSTALDSSDIGTSVVWDSSSASVSAGTSRFVRSSCVDSTVVVSGVGLGAIAVGSTRSVSPEAADSVDSAPTASFSFGFVPRLRMRESHIATG